MEDFRVDQGRAGQAGALREGQAETARRTFDGEGLEGGQKQQHIAVRAEPDRYGGTVKGLRPQAPSGGSVEGFDSAAVM